jgi:AAA+ ATPase superfamily predicted ATPase
MIGRRKEQSLLKEIANREEADFVVVYGRRRVGKTYLVRETFGNEFTFSYAGIARIKAKQQIAEFYRALVEHGLQDAAPPKTWFDAFDCLKRLIVQVRGDHPSEPVVVFLDEMPWMDNHKSDFVAAFEHFWNGWASAQKYITLIVCGSATSWITNKIFRNKGGLHNRVTRQIALKPFTLTECAEFFAHKGLNMNIHDMAESYMIFGGIPYYLDLMDRRLSLTLNVDSLCFGKDALLAQEFDRIFDALFNSPERYVEIIEALSTKKRGLSREELVTLVGFADGGRLTKILAELSECGFIRKYLPFGREKNGALYQLADPFVSFYLEFMKKDLGASYWSSALDNAKRRAWSGYAFEQVCLAHVEQIRKALGISGVITQVSSWQVQKSLDGEGKGAQIDLVLSRNDNVVNLCEMKYSNELFMVDKGYDAVLRDKLAVFRAETKTKKALHLTLVTTYGIKQNTYSSIFQSQVTMQDLLEGA